MAKEKTEGFPAEVRLLKHSQYRVVYKEGRKIHSERFVIFGRQNTVGHPRLGITVSGKIGGSVVRNRIKRVFREIFRRSIREIPNQLDIVVNAKSGCVGASYAELRTEFLKSAERLPKG